MNWKHMKSSWWKYFYLILLWISFGHPYHSCSETLGTNLLQTLFVHTSESRVVPLYEVQGQSRKTNSNLKASLSLLPHDFLDRSTWCPGFSGLVSVWFPSCVSRRCGERSIISSSINHCPSEGADPDVRPLLVFQGSYLHFSDHLQQSKCNNLNILVLSQQLARRWLHILPTSQRRLGVRKTSLSR